MIAGIEIEIWTKHLFGTSLEFDCYTALFRGSINGLISELKNGPVSRGYILVSTNVATTLTFLITVFQDCSTLMSSKLQRNSPKCDNVLTESNMYVAIILWLNSLLQAVRKTIIDQTHLAIHICASEGKKSETAPNWTPGLAVSWRDMANFRSFPENQTQFYSFQAYTVMLCITCKVWYTIQYSLASS